MTTSPRTRTFASPKRNDGSAVRPALLAAMIESSDDAIISKTHGYTFVVMTSSKEEEDVLAAHQLGSNAYLRKPVDFAMVAARVRGLFWLLMNEPPGVPS